MSSLDYQQIVDQFPTSISLPRIDRVHRPSRSTFAEVKNALDLPSRLLFGDLVDDSFRTEPTGWAAAYRDGLGNGLDLKVSDNRFEARPFFLGAESLSVGPAGHREAFLQLISLAGDQWLRVLKLYLEERYPVNVAEIGRDVPTACYMPDGWLLTLMIPIPVDRLGDAIQFHLNMANDQLLGTSQSGSITLQHQIINYVEGRSPDGCGDPLALVSRHLGSCNTPLTAPPVREEATDGSAAWTLRRMAYLYRCTCFLRDVPRVMEKLQAAELLSPEPDMWSAVAPAELVATAEHASWWSAKRACRSTWVGFDDVAASLLMDVPYDSEQTHLAVRQAQLAGSSNAAFFGDIGGVEQCSARLFP
jgi:hypothetical protein